MSFKEPIKKHLSRNSDTHASTLVGCRGDYLQNPYKSIEAVSRGRQYIIHHQHHQVDMIKEDKDFTYLKPKLQEKPTMKMGPAKALIAQSFAQARSDYSPKITGLKSGFDSLPRTVN